jgi:hypothetical protein
MYVGYAHTANELTEDANRELSEKNNDLYYQRGDKRGRIDYATQHV